MKNKNNYKTTPYYVSEVKQFETSGKVLIPIRFRNALGFGKAGNVRIELGDNSKEIIITRPDTLSAANNLLSKLYSLIKQESPDEEIETKIGELASIINDKIEAVKELEK